MQSRPRITLSFVYVSLLICLFLAAPISAVLDKTVPTSTQAPQTIAAKEPSTNKRLARAVPGSTKLNSSAAPSTVEAPVISGLAPASVTAGGAGFSLTVSGANFLDTFVIRINGIDRTTTFVGATQLTTEIQTADIAVAGTLAVSVFDPGPTGGESAPVPLTINNPSPTVTALSPATVTAGALDFTLTVDGSNFNTSSVVHLDGLAKVTTLVSSTQLTAVVPAADIVLAGTPSITVFNPGPGGGTSSALTLTVNPQISNISPDSVRAGSTGFTLTVNGAGFITGAVVRVNGANRSTTFIDSTKLAASISASDISSVGTRAITVLTPAPSNLVSNAVSLTSIPSLSNIVPMTAVAGSGAFTITVTGSGFVNGSVVRWNGNNRTTTFVNSSRLTASITAADVAVINNNPVTVVNPAPNNISSNPINFAVTNPPPATECAIGTDVTAASPGLINSGPARAQLWRTNDNIWWGAFSNNTDGIYFYKRVNPTTWTQGALIDTNFVSGVFVAGAPDCLWTGTNLFVLIQESQTLAKLYKYTYNSSAQTYALVSGFPVNLPLIGVGTSGSGKIYGTLSLQQDSTGRLWAAYTGGGIGGDGNMRVIWSTNSAHTTWDTTGFIVATNLSTIKTEGAGIVSFGGNKIGVAWSNLNASENAFRYHNDADPPTTWSATEVIDSGLGPEGLGPVAGKQISMKAHPDGRIFLLSDDNDGINNHLHVYIRSAAGVWGNKTLVVSDFRAMPSKGVLLLDTENSTIHVVYKDGAITTNGLMGQTFITQASMNNPAFNQACLMIDTSDNDGALSTSNPTSTKQNLNATTDLVIAASTGRGGNRILTNTVDLTPNALTIFGISPAAVTVGESTFTLTVTGKLFNSSSVVRFNNTNRTTTFINAGRLTASIPSSAITTAGTYPIIVRNSSPSADSNVRNFSVTATNPVPTVGLVSPNRETVGSSSFTITVSGTGFRRSSVVRLNGSNKSTQYVSDTVLTATIPSSDLLVPGPYPITVFNPAPGGGTSAVTHVTTLYVMPDCSAPSGQSFSGVTLFNTVKSQMWYNDGLWWGAFSDNSNGIYFYKQNGNSFTKGALLGTNFNGRPDVLWNGTNLFVLVYEFNTLARLYKYTYNTTTDTYSLISGFPISLPLTGIGPGVSAAQTGSITIAQDSTGKLWAAYPGSFTGGDGKYRVIWSTSADHKTWNTTGYVFATGASVSTQEVAPIVHFGGNKIGIVYSRQPTKEVLFISHNDGDPETTWSAPQIVDSGLGHIGVGGVADNHMSLKAAPDGRLFLAAKDSDFPFGYINLYVRNTAGVWSEPVLVDVDPHAAVTRPTLVLDIENSEVYVFYADAASGFMYMNKASMDNPVFGPACPHVDIASVSDSTSTKQNLTASTGLRAVGSTGGPASSIHFNPINLPAGTGNAPVLTSISPVGVGQNSGPATLTVNGSNFASNAVVFFDGADRPTTFVSPTQLTFRIFATDSPTVRNVPIKVMNPKGGSSAAVNLIVGAVVQSFSPASVTAGDPAFTLTINGIGFVSGATVNFNGVVRPATFVNSTQLTAQIQASEIQTYGTPAVFVVNPGGINSAPLNFTVNNPLPTLTAISPATQNAGAGGLTVIVNGTNLNTSSVVTFNGLPRATTFVNTTQVMANILSSDVALGGVFPIVVSNPAPGGGLSTALPFSVLNPIPTTTTISPATGLVGAGGFTLTVNGSNFVQGSVVHFNGAARATTFVNSTRLTAQILASDASATGEFPITVFNPAPDGGTSNAAVFSFSNPVPVVSGISPAIKLVGDDAFTLTVNGSNLVSNSVVRFNGVERPTTFVSGTQLTALLTAADVASSGTYPVSVLNPAPGGGISGNVNLAVNNPVPTLTSLTPSSATAGDPAFSLTVNGTKFNTSSVVRVNGSDRPTTLVSATELVAQITEADIEAGATLAITVFNGAPGGGSTNVGNFPVYNLVPTVSEILPNFKFAGDPAFSLTVNGTNFNSSSIVRINGTNRTTTWVSTTQLTAQITAADLAAAGTPSITVFNPTPAGGTSNPATLTIENAVPAITSISPASRNVGSSTFTLTVNGTGFVNGSVVRFNGTNRTTTFVSSTQLTTSMASSTQTVAGVFPIEVFNPAPGGGLSNAADLTINNSVPTLSSISPTTRTAGTAAFTLTVNGTNFNSTSVVQWGGNARPTTLVTSTQLTAQISAADIAAGGIVPVTVLNPAPGGGTTNGANVTVNNPVPTLTSISPATKTAGDAAFTLTVNGTNFNSGSIVRLNGSNRITTFVSTTQLTAELTDADIQVGGNFPVTVFNPTPSGGTSSAVNLTVNNPLPILTEILPANQLAGDPAFALTVNGSNFNPGSIVRLNGSNRTTTFVSATQLTAQITAADIALAGTPAITVFNPTPGGGTSAAAILTVNNGVPVVSSLSPSSRSAGNPAFTLTVNGSNFVNTSVVRLNGNARTTTFVSSTQLSAAITAADQAAGAVLSITVANPAPGGGISAGVDLTVNNPAPTLSTISPASVAAGGAAFTLTVNGTNFNSSSVIHWAGAARTTTLVNPTQLTTQVSAAEIGVGGSFPITVTNPAPGGGTTTASNLTVNNPTPTLTSIVPVTITAGTGAFELTLNGANFNASSIVRLGGSDRPTSFISTSQLTAQITAADVHVGAVLPVTIFNPAPAGGSSAPVDLTVNNPVPSVAEIHPAAKFVGETDFVLTVNGSNFNASSVVRLNGTDRLTTFVSETQLTAQITATDIQSPSEIQISVYNPAPNGGTSNASSLSVTNPTPAISNLSPASILEGSSAFTLTVNGTNFVPESIVKWNGQDRSTTFVSTTQLTAQIPAPDVGTAGIAGVSVTNPQPGGGTSNVLGLDIDPNGRIVAVTNSSGAANSTVTVPITLSSQGDENTLSFSVLFDTALLSSPNVVLGSDSAGGTLNIDTSEVPLGRLGINVSLPGGQTFVAGLREIVRITFNTASVSSQISTPIEFTDPPGRQVTAGETVELPTIYVSGTVTITLGYEADVAPRPNGSNTGLITIVDWVQAGRFAAGMDTPALGSEFQRADSAPRSTQGDGRITVSDWVQAGRYASALDSPIAANGPTTPISAATSVTTNKTEVSAEKVKTTLRLATARSSETQERTVTLEFETVGNENALGFSLLFDSSRFSFVSARKGDAMDLATLNLNDLDAESGRLGIALALPSGTTFGTGLNQLVVLTFKAKQQASDDSMLVGFGDQPVAREVVDVQANPMPFFFQQPEGMNLLEDAQFFVAQHYLDFLNRTAETAGLEYWTSQLRACGSDAQCLSQRRVQVSAAFFMAPEFQQTGYTLYRLYRAAFGQRPSFQQFSTDRGQLVAGPQLAASTLAFATQFVERAEFRQLYPDSLSAEQFVTRLYSNAGLAAAVAEQRKATVALTNQQQSRAQVLLNLIEQRSFKEREYNAAFVLMQYFGYLRRDPDQGGYDFWLHALNNTQPADYHAMVCSFLTSREYQERFGVLIPRSNQECGQ